MSSSVSSSLTMISDIFFLIFCNCVCDKCWRNDNRSLLTGNSWNDWIKQRSLEELKTALFTFWSHLSFFARHYSTKHVPLAANWTPTTQVLLQIWHLLRLFLTSLSIYWSLSNNMRSSICGSKWVVTCVMKDSALCRKFFLSLNLLALLFSLHRCHLQQPLE